MADISPKPYLLRAIYEWCTDSGYTPHIVVKVDRHTQVPLQYVKNGEIVLNISATATQALSLGNEVLEFEARFGGEPYVLWVPIRNIAAIFARELSEHAWSFPVELLDDAPVAPEAAGLRVVDQAITADTEAKESLEKTTKPEKSTKSRAKLTVIK